MVILQLEPVEICRSLIELANFRGGADNITTIVARLEEPDQDQPKTRVAAEVTLERLLGDMTGYHPRGDEDTLPEESDSANPQHATIDTYDTEEE